MGFIKDMALNEPSMLSHVFLLLTLISALFIIRKAKGVILILGLVLVGLIVSIETSIKFSITQLNEIPYVSLHGLKSMSLELMDFNP